MKFILKAPISQLEQLRDYKGLYKKYRNGKLKNIAGMDIEFKEPTNPDMIIENNAGK